MELHVEPERSPTAASTSVSSRPLLFALNGRRVEIAAPDPSITLLSFLRSRTRLTGTKLSCGEGGCGACLVLLSTYDPKSKRVQESSINSCLALLCSLDGCAITTIEGLGSTRTGFHAVQQRIAGFHGSQCGFCTPGMCISLYSCLRNSQAVPAPAACNDEHVHQHPPHTIPTLSCEDAQNAIVGNICRCTGYRPIVDACKSFAGDVDVEDLGINAFWASAKDAKADLLPPFSRAHSAFPQFLIDELDLREKGAVEDTHGQCTNGCHDPRQAVGLNVKFRDGGENGKERLWIQTTSLEAVFEALHSCQGRSDVKLMVGNTSSGYYKDHDLSTLIDISRVPELLVLKEASGSLIVGAAVTIEMLIRTLEARPYASRKVADANIALSLASHLKKVANAHVRHRASIGGNLIMAQQFGFPSDLATLLLAVDATLHLVCTGGKRRILSVEEFFERGSLEPGWLLEYVSLPLQFADEMSAPCVVNGNSNGTCHASNSSRTCYFKSCPEFTDEMDAPCMANGNSNGTHHASNSCRTCYFKSYRAAPRSLGNSLALINAAFFASVSSSPSHNSAPGTVLGDVRLAFGAFGKAHAIRAHKVEGFLRGKSLTSSVLLKAITMLKDELKPSLKLAKKPSYKLSVAVGYLFEFFLPLLATLDGALNASVHAKNGFSNGANGKAWIGPQSSGASAGRAQISGKQTLPNWEDRFLIGRAMEKSEAKIQAAGEAVYVNDVPSPEHCLYAAFVLSSKAAAKVKHIDPQAALASPGAVAFISAADIPEGGANVGAVAFSAPESLFATDVVEFFGHPLGIMVADSPEHAKAAADKVRVDFEADSFLILSVEDAVAKNSFFSLLPFAKKACTGDIEQGFSEADHRISDAEVKTSSQYYFYMETQTALAIPDEDDTMVVYSSCQSPDHLQKSVSMCLGIPYHNVRILTRRVGGGFGGKATRNITVASACALAAYKLRRPVRMYLDRKTDMLLMGGRHPTKTIYSVAFRSDGKVTGLKASVFVNGGWSEDLSPFFPPLFASGLKKYDWGSMDVDFTVCKTNLSSKSAMRGPGHVQGSFIADTVLEHVACVLGLDVHTIITKNMHTFESASRFFPRNDMSDGMEGYTLPSMWSTTLERMEEKVKKVAVFNAANVWLKRGLSVLPCVYEVEQTPKPARVSIFHDASIVVEVGGIELGQGLWTKVKQATVNGLSQLIMPITASDSIKVRVVQADSISLPHGGFTAGSTASEGSCEAVRQACQLLVERLLPKKLEKERELSRSLSWHDLISSVKNSPVNLSAHVHWFPESGTKSYLNYGVAATEVELDTLTGAVTILQSDVFYDCGKSMNPAVDIGQIEGSFVQGIGFFLTEEYEVDSDGELINNGTWTYKPPTVDNIPQKFTVEMMNSVAHKNRILSSKACGEPPLLLAGSVHSAVRRAIEAAEEDGFSGQDGKKRFFRLDTPASMERVKDLCGLERVEQYLKCKLAATS